MHNHAVAPAIAHLTGRTPGGWVHSQSGAWKIEQPGIVDGVEDESFSAPRFGKRLEGDVQADRVPEPEAVRDCATL